MLRRIAVVGDELEYGGEILPYCQPTFTWDDHQSARVGGEAVCGRCKRTGTIDKTGGPYRLDFEHGEVALDGDVVVCGCATFPRIMARLAGESWCDDGAYESLLPEPQSATAQHTTYNEQYTLTDSDGQPLCGVRYRVRAGSNIVANGVTDSSGKTQRITTTENQLLKLEVAH